MKKFAVAVALIVGVPAQAQEGAVFWGNIRAGMTGTALQAAYPDLPEYKTGRRLYRMESITEFRDTVVDKCVGTFRAEHYPRLVSLEVEIEDCPTLLEKTLTDRYGSPVAVEETERNRRVDWHSGGVWIRYDENRFDYRTRRPHPFQTIKWVTDEQRKRRETVVHDDDDDE